MRVIVTGGAGFIGSHVVDALVERGDEVHVLDNLATGSRENVASAATLHEADIRVDASTVFDRVQPELCVHLGAQADVSTSVQQPDYDAEVNVLGTVRILEAARAHGAQVVFSSTGGAIYGECDRPATELAPRQPLSPYGIAKLAAEEYLAGWNRLYGTTHVALRFANVYGPRQSASLEGGVVAIFLERLADGRATVIYGNGSQTRDFIYVRDVSEAILAAIGHPGGVFNVGTGIETSVTELHAACRQAAASSELPSHGPAREGDVVRSVIDPTLAASALGWRPRTSLDDGLARTWAAIHPEVGD